MSWLQPDFLREKEVRLTNHFDMLICQSAICFERKQMDFMADEKSPSRISHRLFATSRSEKRLRG